MLEYIQIFPYWMNVRFIRWISDSDGVETCYGVMEFVSQVHNCTNILHSRRSFSKRMISEAFEGLKVAIIISPFL
jgi:hypothetical protein